MPAVDKGSCSKSVEVQRVWEVYGERLQFVSRQDALQLDESLNAGDVSRAWLVWSGAAEVALADAFRFSGGPVPTGGLVLGRCSALLRVVWLGGPLVKRARSNAADAVEAVNVFLYRDSSIAPLLDMRRRFKAVMDVLDAMIRFGVALSRSVELTAQWGKIWAFGPLYPVTPDDLDVVRGLGIGEFYQVVSGVHHRLSDFIHSIVVHRRDEAIRGWRNWIREDHRTPGGSGVLADPTRIEGLASLLLSLSVVYRICASARMGQLGDWFQSWVPDSVFSAGGGRGSVEAWYTSSLEIEEVLAGAADSHVHLFVADVVKSFDTVDRSILDRVLSSLGLPGWFRHAYFEYHAHVRLRFKLASGLGEPWTRDGGIPQGCPLSMMFIVALYLPWCRYLSAQVGVRPQLYADNLKCVSHDPDSLLAAARFTTGYVRLVGQEPAPSKCVLRSTV